MKIITYLKNPDNICLIFIIIINLLIFSFLIGHNGYIIAGDDYVPELNPTVFFQKGHYIWSGEYGGLYYYPSLLRWIFNLWFYLGELIGIPTGYIQLSIYYMYSISGEIGIYLFLRKIMNVDPIYSLVGANFYLLNPFTVYLFRSSFYAELYTIAFLPFILISIYYWLKENKFKYLFISQILLLICSPIAVNMPAYMAMIIFIIVYIVFFAALSGYNIQIMTKKIFIFVSLILLLNLWWIIFIPHQIFSSDYNFFDMSVIKWASIESNFVNLFRFLGGWDFTGKFGQIYNPWAHIYEEFPLNVLLFIPSILVFSYFVMMNFDEKRSVKLKVIILSNFSIALLLLFLIKRNNPPFSDFTLYLYSVIPFLWSFRTADVKLMPFVIFIFSIILAVSLDTLRILKINNKKAKNIIKNLSIFGPIIILLFYSIPFYSGEAIKSEGLYNKNISHLINIPGDYTDFSNYYYSNIDDKNNILILPPNSWYKAWYTWGLHGVDIYHSILPFADAYYVFPYNESWSYGEYSVKPEKTMGYVSNKFYWDLVKGKELSIDTFYILGIKYIVYRNDFHTDQPEGNIKLKKINYKKILSRFNSTKRHFGDITLYELNYNISKFYIYNNTNKKSNTYFSLHYSKINPANYNIKLNASKPFLLAFAQTYDPYWVAKVNNTKYVSIPIESTINGFYINDTGNLNIAVEYVPQKWSYYGLSISFMTFMIILVYTVRNKILVK